MALAAGAQPHFTTIAHFVSSMEKEIKNIFLDVLLKCEEQGLIGGENLALDGCLDFGHFPATQGARF
jgi:transposase